MGSALRHILRYHVIWVDKYRCTSPPFLPKTGLILFFPDIPGESLRSKFGADPLDVEWKSFSHRDEFVRKPGRFWRLDPEIAKNRSREIYGTEKSKKKKNLRFSSHFPQRSVSAAYSTWHCDSGRGETVFLRELPYAGGPLSPRSDAFPRYFGSPRTGPFNLESSGGSIPSSAHHSIKLMTKTSLPLVLYNIHKTFLAWNVVTFNYTKVIYVCRVT